MAARRDITHSIVRDGDARSSASAPDDDTFAGDDVLYGRVVGMDMVAGYRFREDLDTVATVPLAVNACGRYRMVTRTEFSTFRPHGRRDYQLLYVHAGTATFYKAGAPYLVGPGTAVLYHPGETQRYVYRAADRTEMYWAHFSGTHARELASVFDRNAETASTPAASSPTTNTAVSHADIGAIAGIAAVGTSSEYIQLFNRMIAELQLQQSGFEDLVALDFQRLVLLMRRHIVEVTGGGAKRIPTVVQEAVRYFHQHYSEDISIEEYADEHGMSAGRFIRIFRESIGMPPLRYITSIRLSEAKMLLESTDYSIGDIADMVGYDNPLYFSRLFRSRFGGPPSQYRR
ncbi:AraC family transcriptional regulator [Bifidobacterium goeldii]|uniref:AraC family transcriptional regulator n=1 Tax=Bifidobacterium goeldii TaxID=2306975 RepID=A0A430FD75_9BIFI|nr:AraC family transcriptional regulator [Bifidobacterium goeldii]RSX50824.1 AraC family transcriptional regulator [Bifidobacterium goeldii]